jgi:hypothetical protein
MVCTRIQKERLSDTKISWSKLFGFIAKALTKVGNSSYTFCKDSFRILVLTNE